VLPPSVAAATYSGPDERFMIRTIGNPKSPRRRASLIQNGKLVEKYSAFVWVTGLKLRFSGDEVLRVPGSARVSRVGFGVPPKQSFL
jgi:hypothetical protein